MISRLLRLSSKSAVARELAAVVLTERRATRRGMTGREGSEGAAAPATEANMVTILVGDSVVRLAAAGGVRGGGVRGGVPGGVVISTPA